MSTEILQNPLAWHQEAWLNTLRQFRSGQMPHAYLISAEADTGKRLFAMMFAQFLLCRSPGSHAACGGCSMCMLNQAGSHPDLLIVEPEDGSKIIKVDQIRELKKFLDTSSHSFGKRIIILDTAESLGINSANALLKGLEEPPADVLFLLLTDRPRSVLATVTSRAQTLRLPRPERAQALSWLRSHTPSNVHFGDLDMLLDFVQGRPLAAKAMHDSGSLTQQKDIGDALLKLLDNQLPASTIANRFAKTQGVDLLCLLLYWLGTLCKHQLDDTVQLKGNDLRTAAHSLLKPNCSKIVQTRALFSLYNEVLTAQSLLSGTSNPNAQLLLEDILIGLNRLARFNSPALSH